MCRKGLFRALSGRQFKCDRTYVLRWHQVGTRRYRSKVFG